MRLFTKFYEGGNTGAGGWAGAAIGGGISLGGQIGSIFAQNAENNRARNFADWNMRRDHEWALEDWAKQNERDDMLWNRQNEYNLSMWNMENAYNSPAAQMERFKAAGLNPNLMYGQSNMGGTIGSAQPNRSPVRNVSGANPSFGHVGSFEFFNQIVPQMLAARQADANIDLTRAQIEATREEASLKSIQQLLGLADRDLKTQEYGQRSQLNPISIQAQRLANIKLTKETESIIQSIAESSQRISASKMEQSRANQMLPYQKRDLDTRATKQVNEGWHTAMEAYGKDLENKAREAGINPNEMGVMRLLMEMIYGKSAHGKPTYFPGPSPYIHK